MDRTEPIGHHFRRIREACDMTQDEFAKLVGKTGAAISQWETGKSVPEFETFISLMRRIHAIQSPVDWNGLMEAFDAIFGGPLPRVVPATKVPGKPGYSPEAFEIRLSDASMEPDFREGSTVIIEPRIAPQPGSFVLAMLDGQEYQMFRKFRLAGFDQLKPIIELVPVNQDWPTIRMDAANPGKILGVMVEYRQRARQITAPL